MVQMSGRRRVRASWLLLVLFVSVSLGVCTTGLSATGGKLPCCADVHEASFTSCCSSGQQSPTSELPVGMQAPPPPVTEIAFEIAPQTAPDRLSRRESFCALPYASADAQALLSTFLI